MMYIQKTLRGDLDKCNENLPINVMSNTSVNRRSNEDKISTEWTYFVWKHVWICSKLCTVNFRVALTEYILKEKCLIPTGIGPIS
jgi:hypothetical protein